MMTAPEFSRMFDVRQCHGKQVELTANEQERAALAERFGLVRIDRLEARLSLSRKDRTVDAWGTIEAEFVQSCAVSAEDLPVTVSEEIAFRFVPETGGHSPDDEIEIDAHECDEIDYAGTDFDLGEAVSQSLALAVDPFATGPEAEEARTRFEDREASPFAALAALKIGQDKPGKP